ncbi:Os03g0683600 [Oryza sativa Japonica Group]|nr:hypothetical protein OsJ_12132 [Oryza sativa Japonica Group]BAS85780.1 Os03g0683600 [Oryza sativa Japonica Group]
MEYVPIPRVDLPLEHDGDCHGRGYCAERALASRHCVQLSDGKFRCVDMGSASDGVTTKVPMHTQIDPGTKVWTLEYAVSFADIWASESYKATGMSEKAPVLALVHPKNPNMVYFFVEVTSLRTTDFYGLYVLAHSLQDESGGAVPRR